MTKWGRTSDQKLNYIRALLYGESGRGKTTSLRTLPVERTAIIVAGERGALPLREFDFLARQVGTWAEIEAVALEIKAGQLPDGIRNVAVDSLSAISELCKFEIVTVARKALVRSKTEKVYDELMTQEDWGLYLARMKNLIGTLTSAPYNVFCTALAQWTEDKRSASIRKTPAFQGKLSLQCAQYFDLVIYMDSVRGENGEERVWRTASDSVVEAKDASGKLNPIEPTDWGVVLTKVLPKQNKKPQTQPSTESTPKEA